MDNGYGTLTLVGIIILGIATSFKYDMITGFTTIAIGFIVLGIVGAMFRHSENKRN